MPSCNSLIKAARQAKGKFKQSYIHSISFQRISIEPGCAKGKLITCLNANLSVIEKETVPIEAMPVLPLLQAEEGP